MVRLGFQRKKRKKTQSFCVSCEDGQEILGIQGVLRLFNTSHSLGKKKASHEAIKYILFKGTAVSACFFLGNQTSSDIITISRWLSSEGLSFLDRDGECDVVELTHLTGARREEFLQGSSLRDFNHVLEGNSSQYHVFIHGIVITLGGRNEGAVMNITVHTFIHQIYKMNAPLIDDHFVHQYIATEASFVGVNSHIDGDTSWLVNGDTSWLVNGVAVISILTAHLPTNNTWRRPFLKHSLKFSYMFGRFLSKQTSKHLEIGVMNTMEKVRADHNSDGESFTAEKSLHLPNRRNARIRVGVTPGESSRPWKQLSPVVKVNPETLHKQVEFNKFSVIGRIVLERGVEPWEHAPLKEKLSSVWNIQRPWKLIDLGKGFYQIWLASEEDNLAVWSKEIVNLQPGILRLQNYRIGFDPFREKTTHTQAWFRIHHLPWGLWEPKIISDIVMVIGTPIRLDNTTVDGEFGHFARILVDVDLSKPIRTSVLLECENEVIDIRIVPEMLPKFCKECHTIGHLAMDCWTLHFKDVTPRDNSKTACNRNGKGIRIERNREDGEVNVLISSTDMEATDDAHHTDVSVKGKRNLVMEDIMHGQEKQKQKMARTQDENLVTRSPIFVLHGDQDKDEGLTLSASIPHRRGMDLMEEEEEANFEEATVGMERKRPRSDSPGQQRPCTRSQSKFL